MPNADEAAAMISAKVAEILATSSLQPGLREVRELMKVISESQVIDSAHASDRAPDFGSQVSHL